MNLEFDLSPKQKEVLEALSTTHFVVRVGKCNADGSITFRIYRETSDDNLEWIEEDPLYPPLTYGQDGRLIPND